MLKNTMDMTVIQVIGHNISHQFL